MKNTKIIFLSLFMLIAYACNEKEIVSNPEFGLAQSSKKLSEIRKQFYDAGARISEKSQTNENPDCSFDFQNNLCDPIPLTQSYVINYQGCDITVTQSFYLCFDDKGNAYFVTDENPDYEYDFSNNLCWELISSWYEIYQEHGIEAVYDAIDEMEAFLEIEWELLLVQSYMGISGGIFDCNNPSQNANVWVENYRGTCYQLCINQTDDGISWKSLRCGFGCCVRTSTYCVDENGEIVSNTTIEVLTACNYDPEPYPDEGCFWLLECKETCSKIR